MQPISSQAIANGADAIIIRNIFSSETHQSLLSHAYSRNMRLRSTQDDTFGRLRQHSPKVLDDIHPYLTNVMSNLVGEPLKPSYTYIALYDNNGICPIHVDREPCRWTLDYCIDLNVDEPWLLHVSPRMTDHERRRDAVAAAFGEQAEQIKQRNKWTSIDLSPNDAAIFSGTHSWHYRDRIEGRNGIFAFFHFVREDFDGPLY